MAFEAMFQPIQIGKLTIRNRVLSTAHAAKFPEDVARISGAAPALPRGVASLADRPERFDRLPAEAETIKAYVRAFAEGQGS